MNIILNLTSWIIYIFCYIMDFDVLLEYPLYQSLWYYRCLLERGSDGMIIVTLRGWRRGGASYGAMIEILVLIELPGS
jgi:hypothetical protein